MIHSQILGKRSIRSLVSLAWIGLICVSLISSSSIFAQTNDAKIFRSYSLKNAAAENAKAVLSQMTPDADIVIDATKNRILVNSSAANHQTIQQMLPLIDKVQVKVPVEPFLKSYSIPVNQLGPFAQQLKTKYQANKQVRIASDPRTSQLIVFGTPDVHDTIKNQLGLKPQANSLPKQPVAAFPPQQPNAVPQPRPAQPVAQQPIQRPIPQRQPVATGPVQVRLQHSSWRTVQDKLYQLFGKRLSQSQGITAGELRYTIQNNVGEMIILDANPSLKRVLIQGKPIFAQSFAKLIYSIDDRSNPNKPSAVVPLQNASMPQVRQAINTYREANSKELIGAAQQKPVAKQVAQAGPAPAGGVDGNPTAGQPNGTEQPAEAAPAENPDSSALIGSVQLEFIEDLGMVVIKGDQRDVAKVMKIINDIEKLSSETEPLIEVFPLEYVDSEALAAIVIQIHEQILSPRQGRVTITPLVKPNALLLIGQNEAIKSVVELIKRLDQPVGPATQFEVFRLKHASAGAVQETLEQFFEDRQALGTKVLVTADIRSNSLIVRASPRDMAEVELMLKRIDTTENQNVHEIRVFKLENSLAEELAPILQEAVLGSEGGQGPGQQGNNNQSAEASRALRLITVDTKGKQAFESGILSDVRITADTRANAVIVSAPSESLALIEELIERLDKIPAAEAQIKVFTIINGDATALVEMLEALFGQSQASGVANSVTGGIQGESTLVPMRFSVDSRTNSIVATGMPSDLEVVEAILLRLDESDVRERKTSVYRLQYAPADVVAEAINQFLQDKSQKTQNGALTFGPFEQIEREVIVVPEVVGNTLVVSATPRFFDEINDLIKKLDDRPPMVMIQVLIAEVTLNNTDEFGVELGIQDSILFDRSLLSDLVTTTNTTQTNNGGAIATVTDQVIQGATNTPGFDFNGVPLGNSGSDKSIATKENLAGQAISNFAVGNINGELGFGGMVLSAGSDSINILVRALQESRRLDILSRPQVMTLNNQRAYIQVGQRVPRIVGTQINETGQVNQIQLEPVGLILEVTPKISPDGMVMMQIIAEKSNLGPEADGIPISIASNGDVIRSPKINTTTAQTTVSSASGQTIVLGGLITKSTSETHRAVPVLGNMPLLKNFFRFDSTAVQRTELIIVMTPHVIYDEEDIELMKHQETSRINWCISDVENMHGDQTLRSRGYEWTDSETEVIFPDNNPTGTKKFPVEVLPSQALNESVPADPNANLVPTPEGRQPVLKPANNLQPVQHVDPPDQLPAQEPLIPLGGADIRLRQVDPVAYQPRPQPRVYIGKSVEQTHQPPPNANPPDQFMDQQAYYQTQVSQAGQPVNHYPVQQSFEWQNQNNQVPVTQQQNYSVPNQPAGMANVQQDPYGAPAASQPVMVNPQSVNQHPFQNRVPQTQQNGLPPQSNYRQTYSGETLARQPFNPQSNVPPATYPVSR